MFSNTKNDKFDYILDKIYTVIVLTLFCSILSGVYFLIEKNIEYKKAQIEYLNQKAHDEHELLMQRIENVKGGKWRQ